MRFRDVGWERGCSSVSPRTPPSAGIERFVAEVSPGNRAMLGMFEDAGFELSRELEDGVVEVGFDLAPTEDVPDTNLGT